MKIRLYEIILLILNIIFYIFIINEYENIKENFLHNNKEKDSIFLFYCINFVIILLNIFIVCIFSENVANIFNKIFNFIIKILKTEFKI